MIQEPQTWAICERFSRRPRQGARSIIDCRCVIEIAATDAQASTTTNHKARQMVIAIIAVRGSKGLETISIDNYAGTSLRDRQIVLVSGAVRRGWDICTPDISKAFLRIVTCEELAAATGS